MAPSTSRWWCLLCLLLYDISLSFSTHLGHGISHGDTQLGPNGRQMVTLVEQKGGFGFADHDAAMKRMLGEQASKEREAPRTSNQRTSCACKGLTD